MREASAQEIENKVEDCIKNHKKWHYHLLTPGCKFNKQQKYALFFENPEDKEVLVSYSERPEVEISRRLAGKLHGEEVFHEEAKAQEPSLGAQRILNRIKKLNASNKGWHHHMFFPNCVFNNNKGKWTIVLEDTEEDQLLESVSDQEPKRDLKYIETLFYQQKKVA